MVCIPSGIAFTLDSVSVVLLSMGRSRRRAPTSSQPNDLSAGRFGGQGTY
jgi:hypothetical protein